LSEDQPKLSVPTTALPARMMAGEQSPPLESSPLTGRLCSPRPRGPWGGRWWRPPSCGSGESSAPRPAAGPGRRGAL